MGWSLTTIFASLAAFLIVATVIGVIDARRKGRGYSMVPFLSGLLGCAASVFSPQPWLRQLWWLPLLLDLSIPVFRIILLQAAFGSGPLRN